MTDYQLTPRQQRIKELQAELAEGKRAEAVKAYRTATGCGLREAALALGAYQHTGST